jgi:hypothetical protein
MNWYVDAVTLENFGEADSLSHLLAFLIPYGPPHWTDGVKGEVLAGIGVPRCDRVLACSELDRAVEVPLELARDVDDARIALGGGFDAKHRGEAESIALALSDGGGFITDDGAAHDYASHQLGAHRVLDTVGVLKCLVAEGHFTAWDAKMLADAMRGAGRHLAYWHPPTLTVHYFMTDS